MHGTDKFANLIRYNTKLFLLQQQKATMRKQVEAYSEQL